MFDVLKNMLIKALYAVAGLLATWLGMAADVIPPPDTDSFASWLWFTVIAAALTGLAAQIKRWIGAGLTKLSN